MLFDGLNLTFILCALGAGILVGFGKAGIQAFGMLAILTVIQFFPAKIALVMITPVLFSGDIITICLYRKKINFNILVRLLPIVFCGIVIGAYIFMTIEQDDLIRYCLGLLILSLTLLQLLHTHFQWNIQIQKWRYTQPIGLVSGIVTAIAHASGALTTLYFLSRGLTKEKLLGTAAAYYLIVNAMKLGMYTYYDMIPSEILSFTLIALPGILIGCLCGRFCIKQMSKETFTVIAYTVPILTGLRLLLS